jgi:hypothetical protein
MLIQGRIEGKILIIARDRGDFREAWRESC